MEKIFTVSLSGNAERNFDMMNFDFSGKVIVVSGGGSGMGFLTCKRFCEMGGSAVLSDINKETLDKCVDEINAIREGAAVGVVCDVRNYDEVCNVCRKAIDTYGRIDAVVPFAGGAELRVLHDVWKSHTDSNDFCDIPIEIYDWSLDVNLRSQMYFDHAATKYMREQKSGVLIHIGSVTGQEGCYDSIGYATAKSGAMNGLTKSMALFGAKYGIRCNCVAPGPVLTRPGMANMKTLEGRAAEPSEIVDLVLYLISDDGSFFNGVTLLCDGGRSIMWNRS